MTGHIQVFDQNINIMEVGDKHALSVVLECSLHSGVKLHVFHCEYMCKDSKPQESAEEKEEEKVG